MQGNAEPQTRRRSGREAQIAAASAELVNAVQRLSLARTAGEVQEIVRTTARRLCQADGATLILRDADDSWYVDEDAIEPLWKGQRFPLDNCLGGWVILHREQLVVRDIEQDERVPREIYAPTFVRAITIVPIRPADPIGAIGNYWRAPHEPSALELELLQALADATAVALENVALWSEMERRIAARTAALAAALEERDALLGTLAHELRNAVGGARGLIDFALREAELDPEVREDLRLAFDGTTDALEIVDQQLDLARVRAGRLTPRTDDCDVGELLADIARTYRTLVHSEAVALVVDDVSPTLRLQTDRHLLAQVLRNLVSNAMKFTDEGAVRLAAAPAAPDHVAISVIDTGVGIDRADLDRIFNRFEQVDAAQSGRPLGTGLGLPYVHEVVATLGGELAVDSTPGRGSTFTITLPRRDAPPAGGLHGAAS